MEEPSLGRKKIGRGRGAGRKWRNAAISRCKERRQRSKQRDICRARMIEQRRNPTFGTRNYPFPSRFRPRGGTWQPLAVVSHKSGGQRVRGMRVFVHACVTRDAFRVEYRRVSSKYWFWSIPVCLTAAPSYFPCISLLSSTIFTTRFASRSPFPDVHAHPVERNTHNITSVNTRNRYFLSLSLFVSLGWLLGSRTDVGGSSLERNNRLDPFSRKVSLESFLRFDFTVKHFDWKRRCCESFPNSIRHGMKNDDEREPSLLQISRGRGIHPLVSVRGGCMQFEWTTNERKKWIGDSQSH